MNFSQRLKKLEEQILPEPEPEFPPEFFWETSGQLAAMMPPGAYPVMPADVFVKPDLSSAIAPGIRDGKVKPPDYRNRERPE